MLHTSNPVGEGCCPKRSVADPEKFAPDSVPDKNTKQNSSLREFMYDFLMNLVEVLIFKDPEPGAQNVPDPQHCL